MLFRSVARQVVTLYQDLDLSGDAQTMEIRDRTDEIDTLIRGFNARRRPLSMR